MTFIAQLIGTGCVIVSTVIFLLICCQPLKCCKRTKISPEDFSEAFYEFVQTQRTTQELQRDIQEV